MVMSREILQSFPTLVLIDRGGVIRAVHTGFAPGLRDELVQEIDELLAGGAAEEEPGQKPAAKESTE